MIAFFVTMPNQHDQSDESVDVQINVDRYSVNSAPNPAEEAPRGWSGEWM